MHSEGTKSDSTLDDIARVPLSLSIRRGGRSKLPGLVPGDRCRRSGARTRGSAVAPGRV